MDTWETGGEAVTDTERWFICELCLLSLEKMSTREIDCKPTDVIGPVSGLFSLWLLLWNMM